MGNKQSCLSDELYRRVHEIFSKIDVDGSKTIDKEETLKYWYPHPAPITKNRKSNFAKLNTEALFNAVDKDGNGSIDLDEWLDFWKAVKNAGHNEEEIFDEVIWDQ
jgi:Ca2+-binding EF-hand superfamily protein